MAKQFTKKIKLFPKASRIDINDGHFSSDVYWKFIIEPAYRPSSAKQILKDSLIDSVCDQVCDKKILLSLSGGYDSSGILGILAKHGKIDSLETFSYVSGPPTPGCDALVAQKMATLSGVPHSMVDSYSGDFSHVISLNAQYGQGICNFSDEIDAWEIQGQKYPNSVLLAGDECFGWMERKLTSVEDVQITVSLRAFQAASLLFPLMTPKVVESMTNAMQKTIEETIRNYESKNLHDMKDEMYLDQKIQNSLLPCRRFISGTYFEVREPLLQTSVLDVVRQLPLSDRMGKRLYREAIQELLPEIFSIKRATTGQGSPNWRDEIIRNKEIIATSLKVSSPLDAYISPSAIMTLVRSMETEIPPKATLTQTIRHHVGPTLAKVLRKYMRPEFSPNSSKDVLVRRLLTLRQFLQT